jgi:hypothetical protein
MAPFPVDPDSQAQCETFAVVRTTRQNRKRFPESCVTPVSSQEEALDRSDASGNLFAAVVYGPSVSSESQRIYHLVRWVTRDTSWTA